MMPRRKFSIVTPCRNAAHLIGRTVTSIFEQSALRESRIEIEHIVCDGASSDDTLDKVAAASRGKAIVISEPDQGMYDALAKGLRRATGDIVAYINAGDSYQPYAFGLVAELFNTRGTQWLTGDSVIMNPSGEIIRVRVPFRFRRRLIDRGVYGSGRLPFIQQESTFWSSELNASIDTERLKNLRLAGDFYLWRTFARVAELTVVESPLGAFLIHPGQQSEDLQAYRREMKSLSEPLSLADQISCLIEGVGWQLPSRLKKLLNSEHFIRWDRESGAWR